MSRIGKLPIPIDRGVEVKIDRAEVSAQGPKGTLSWSLPGGITAELADKTVVIRRRDDSKGQRALHGLARALVANVLHGVGQGFAKELEIHGVGYRAEVAGGTLKLALGFSHPVEFSIPGGIEVAVDRNTRIRVSGCDKQQVGQVAADIRALRPPDVYKLKGIRYAGESLRKKAGKTGVK